MKRPKSLDSTTLLSELRGDRFPQTNHGLAQAVLELVDEVETATCATTAPMRAVLWVTLHRPWWAWFMGSLWRRLVLSHIRHVVNVHGAAEVKFEIQVV